jgi:ParB/RepB/Spo0J family partition protein
MSADPVTPLPASVHTPSRLIPLAEIKQSPTNPRKTFAPGAMADLTASVQQHGVLEPVIVRPFPGKAKGDIFELVAGERRWRAAAMAGLKEIPALVREMTDEEVLEIQVVENLQRQDLHPLEEAHGYHALTRASAGYDVARIAERVGRSTTYVYERLKLLCLIEDAQEVFRSGLITPAHANILARLTPTWQEIALDRSTGGLWTTERPLFAPDGPKEVDPVKAVSARELQAWVDAKVRIQEDDPELPHLFPEMASNLEQAYEKSEKVVHITYSPQLPPEAKDGPRVYGPMSWRRADKKTCTVSVLGVVVVGAGRGDAFRVCIDKKGCRTHWAEEQRATKTIEKAVNASGATGADRYALERKKQEEEARKAEEKRKAWADRLPVIRVALAAAIKVMPVPITGQLANVVIDDISNNVNLALASRCMTRGRSAEDLVRYAAFLILMGEAETWNAAKDFPGRLKSLGLDPARILGDAVTPAAAAAKPKTSKAKATPKKTAKKK